MQEENEGENIDEMSLVDRETCDLNFVAMKVEPNGQNGLKKYFSSSRKEKSDECKFYVVLEFRSYKDVLDLLGIMRTSREYASFADKTARLSNFDASTYVKAFIEFDQSNAARESRTAFIDGRGSDDVILVYPFEADQTELSRAAEGLLEASGAPLTDAIGKERESDLLDPMRASPVSRRGGLSLPGPVDSPTPAKCRNRSHFLTIRIRDYERLDPGEWLNDTLVDFWLRW